MFINFAKEQKTGDELEEEDHHQAGLMGLTVVDNTNIPNGNQIVLSPGMSKYFYLEQACDFSGFLFTNLPLPQNCLERREVATKERKK